MSECECHPKVKCGREIRVEISPHPAREPSALLSGPIESMTVSASTKVCAGEFVQKVLEYAPIGEELKCLTEDVKILDARELSQGRVGVVFTQGGKTKLKIVAMDKGELVMGNTLVILADEPVESATLVEIATDKALVIYPYDSDTYGAVITLQGRASALAYTDIWLGSEIDNLCACSMEDGTALVAGALVGTSPEGGDGEMWVWRIQQYDRQSGPELIVPTRVRVDADADLDGYTGAWSITRVDNDVAVLAYFRSSDKPVGFTVLNMADPASVRLMATGKYATSLPCISVAPLGLGRWIMAYGVSWMAADGAIKSALAMEVWGLTRYAAELMWYGCDAVAYDTGIGMVCALSAGTGAGVVLNYTPLQDQDAVGRTAFVATEADPPVVGPGAPAAGHNGFCRLVPISQTKGILLRKKDGNAWARMMQLEERVVPGQGYIHGLAVTAGDPGQKISVKVSKLDTST